MGAVLLAHAKEVRDDGSVVEIVIWELPEQLRSRLPINNRHFAILRPNCVALHMR